MTTPRSFPKQDFAGGTPFRGPLFWPKFKPFIWWWWWRFWWSKATRLLEISRSRLTLRPRQRQNGKKTKTVENTQIQRQIHFARCHIHLNTKCQNLVLKEKFGCSKKNLVLKEKFGINLALKGPPMKNLVCNEKFGINCASAEAQFGTGRGISRETKF